MFILVNDFELVMILLLDKLFLNFKYLSFGVLMKIFVLFFLNFLLLKLLFFLNK